MLKYNSRQIDVSFNEAASFSWACGKGHLNIVKRMLRKKELEPKLSSSNALEKSICNLQVDIIYELLADGRTLIDSLFRPQTILEDILRIRSASDIYKLYKLRKLRSLLPRDMLEASVSGNLDILSTAEFNKFNDVEFEVILRRSKLSQELIYLILNQLIISWKIPSNLTVDISETLCGLNIRKIKNIRKFLRNLTRLECLGITPNAPEGEIFTNSGLRKRIAAFMDLDSPNLHYPWEDFLMRTFTVGALAFLFDEFMQRFPRTENLLPSPSGCFFAAVMAHLFGRAAWNRPRNVVGGKLETDLLTTFWYGLLIVSVDSLVALIIHPSVVSAGFSDSHFIA